MTRSFAPLLALTLIAAPLAAQDRAAVIATYADIAHATYADTLEATHGLSDAVAALVATPSAEALDAARAAWRRARASYMQTEAFRFGNPLVDAWEPQVNSWPLDEGLIDYVDGGSYGGATDENPFAALNVIATPRFVLGTTEVDAGAITPDLLTVTLQGADGVEANVAVGWHAVEFLLWGQDLHGTGPGAGERPWTDFAKGADCTHGNCDRRGAYLTVATDLLVADLEAMVPLWADDGAARAALEADPDAAIGAMLTGIGSLSYGELAGERMKLGLLLHDPEEEQDCFSDNTAHAHYGSILGIRNVWQGRYVRPDGSVVEGPSLADLVQATDPALAAELGAEIDATLAAAAALQAKSDSGMAYDQMLAMGNAEGNALIQTVIDGLVTQTRSIERVIAALGATSTIEGSDSLP
jgi:putative iron-regulated protein